MTVDSTLAADTVLAADLALAAVLALAADSTDTGPSSVPGPIAPRKNPYALSQQAYACGAFQAWSLCLVWEPSCFPAYYLAAGEYGYQEPYLPVWEVPCSTDHERFEAHGARFHFPHKAVF